MRKRRRNLRETNLYATYINSGYLYLNAAIRYWLADHGVEPLSCDVYIDDHKIKIDINDDGEYTMSRHGSGFKVCLYSDRDCGIQPRRYPVEMGDSYIEFAF